MAIAATTRLGCSGTCIRLLSAVGVSSFIDVNVLGTGFGLMLRVALVLFPSVSLFHILRQADDAPRSQHLHSRKASCQVPSRRSDVIVTDSDDKSLYSFTFSPVVPSVLTA